MGSSVQLGRVLSRDVQCVDSRLEETLKACLVFWQFTDFFLFLFFFTNLVMVSGNPFNSCRSKTVCINISLKYARSHVLKADVAMLEM